MTPSAGGARDGGRDLPLAGRHPAGDRAGGRARAGAERRSDRRTAASATPACCARPAARLPAVTGRCRTRWSGAISCSSPSRAAAVPAAWVAFAAASRCPPPRWSAATSRCPRATILDLLSRLIDQSLVQVVEGPTAAALPAADDRAPVRVGQARATAASGATSAARHAAMFHDLGPGRRSGLAGPDQVRWLESSSSSTTTSARRWAGCSRRARRRRPSWRRACGRSSTSVATTARPAAGSSARSRRPQRRRSPAAIDALLKAGEVAFLQCDYRVAIDHLERALELDRRRSPRGAGRRLPAARLDRPRAGALRGVAALASSRAEIWAELGDARRSRGLGELPRLRRLAGRRLRAGRAGVAQALAEFRRAGNLRDVAATLVSLGAAAALPGRDRARGRSGWSEALAISRRLGFQEGDRLGAARAGDPSAAAGAEPGRARS